MKFTDTRGVISSFIAAKKKKFCMGSNIKIMKFTDAHCVISVFIAEKENIYLTASGGLLYSKNLLCTTTAGCLSKVSWHGISYVRQPCNGHEIGYLWVLLQKHKKGTSTSGVI